MGDLGEQVECFGYNYKSKESYYDVLEKSEVW